MVDEATISEAGRCLARVSPPGTRVILFGSEQEARLVRTATSISS